MQLRTPIALSLAAAQLLCALPSWAQEPVPEAQAAPMPDSPISMDGEARKHFELGRTFYESGRFREAAEEFNEAYRLSKRPELLYNVYVAQRDAGQLEAAVEALRNYLNKVEDAPDSINLRARLATMEAQLAQREEDARTRDRSIAEANARADALRVRTERVPSVIPWVLIGAGAALGAASAVTGGIALGKGKTLDDQCNSGRVCRSDRQDDIDALKKLSITTDVLIGVGAASAVTGLVLLLTHALDSEREVPAVGASAGPNHFVTTFTRRF